ncbi:MAG: DUF4230 domain-containing protein [Ferruginibacter sp.]
MKYYLKLLFFLLLFTGCNKKKEGIQEIVSVLQQTEELGTVEYTITKVVKATDNKTWFKPGERKILITCEAIVKAGIDLKGITEKDVSRSGKTITIHLPTPKILSVNLPPEKIKVAFEKVGLFRDPFTGKERDGLLVQAENQIIKSGMELGIIDQAKINTQLLLSRVFTQLGFTKIILSYDKPITGN